MENAQAALGVPGLIASAGDNDAFRPLLVTEDGRGVVCRDGEGYFVQWCPGPGRTNFVTVRTAAQAVRHLTQMIAPRPVGFSFVVVGGA